MSDDDNFETRYEKLRGTYVRRVRDRLERIEDLAAGLREEFAPEDLEQLEELVHKLAGSGETMGFPAVSSLSIELEERLREVDSAENGQWLDELSTYCRRVREVLAEEDPG